MSDEAAVKVRIAELERRNAEQAARIKQLERMVRELTARLGMNSGNSSMPPSSDSMRGPVVRKAEPSGRKRGGQPGHPGATRAVFPAEQVDRVLSVLPERCGSCRRALTGPDRLVEARQVVEVPPTLAEVIEYRRYRRICRGCGAATVAEFPKGMPVSCVGPRLQAVLTTLTGRYRLSRREACDLATAIYGPKGQIALGTISALEGRTSQVLAPSHGEALAAVRSSRAANTDETSWPEGKGKGWLWGAATPEVAAFLIDRHRSAAAYHRLMGPDYAGVLGTDRWTSYHGHPPSRRQLCWAHLKRNFQALTEQGHKGATHVGRVGLQAQKAVSRAWRGFQEGRIAHGSLRRLLHPVRKRLKEVLLQASHSTDPKAAALSRDVLKRFTSLWTFTRREGVEPTNNRAERALRKAVLWRKGSFGSDSPRGSRFAERMLTVAETLRIQGRSIVDFIDASIRAHLAGAPHPSLLRV